MTYNNTTDQNHLNRFSLTKISEIYEQLNKNPKLALLMLDANLNPVFVDKIEKVPYSGKIYDVDVPNDIILVKKKGKAIWSGNSNGKFGQGLNFNGISSYVEVNDSDSLDTINKEITIEAWIKTNFSQRETIVENWFYNKSATPAIGNRSYICTIRDDGKVDFAISPYGNGTDAVWLNSNNSIKADKWTHVVFLSNGTDMSIYVNGILDGRTSAPSQIHLSNRQIHIGMWFAEEAGESPFTSYFNGVIDELRILSRALTLEEILNDYALGEGSHSVTVYANDTSGNWNSSTVYFSIGTTITTTTIVTTTTTSTTIPGTTTTTLPATTTSTTVPVTTTTSTTTTLPCTLPGDYPTCGEVTLTEVVDFIILWSQGLADLEDVLNLINAWATG